MPFIDVGDDFKDAKETPLAPEAEYDLIIRKSPAHDTENNKNNLVVSIEFETEDYSPFRHWIALPHPDDEKKDREKGNKPGTTRKTKMLMAKRFCYLFDIPYTENGFNTDDFVGARARGLVSQREVNGQNGTFMVNSLELPRLPEEASAA